MRSTWTISMTLAAWAFSACSGSPPCDDCITNADCPPGTVCTDGCCKAKPDMGCAPVGDDDTCDGLDNDCDGTTDEAWQGQQACGLGPCAMSATPAACADGVETPCAPGMPATETCNAVDDDCDGVADETFDLSQSVAHCGACDSPCAPANAIPFCREGVCAMAGCEAGFADCDGSADNGCETEGRCPPDGTCDGIDDDNDGRLDEDFVPDTDCGEGLCRLQTNPSSCVNGMLTACVPGDAAADDRTCNGLDEDCDGSIDEDYAAIERCGVGACAATATPSACVDGDEEPCEPGAPSAEACNGIDDDCDGTVDNGFDLLADRENCGRCGAVCAPAGAEGACIDGACRLARCLDGFFDCNGDPFDGCEVEGPCPSEAECDGVDDDGDGRVDEAFVPVERCGEGVCAAGATASTCLDGHLVQCVPGRSISERDTLCNGLDDDCDGAVDEDYVPVTDCGEGLCRDNAVASSCADGVETPCEPGDPQDESCDGRDEDCDGAIDNGLGLDAPCAVAEGLCARAGRTVCGADGEVVCGAEPGAPLPDDRQCDGLDTDCDGVADEDYVGPQGVACEGARGVCAAASVFECVRGVAQCIPGEPSEEEICNALDDDCDGRHDEQDAEWQAPVEVPFAGQIVGEPRRSIRSRMVWTGEMLGVVWREVPPASVGVDDSAGAFTVLDSRGTLLEPGITRRLTDASVSSPRITWDGERFLASWTDFSDDLIKYRRAHPDPRRSGPVVPLYSGLNGNLRAAGSGSHGPLLAWYGPVGNTLDVYIGPPRPDAPSRGHQLTAAPLHDRHPRMAFAPDRVGVSWARRGADNTYSLWFRTVTPSGRPLSPEVPFGQFEALRPGHPDANPSAYHAVTWAGRGFVAAWVEEIAGTFSMRTRALSYDGEMAGRTLTHDRPDDVLSRDLPMLWIPELQSIAIAWSEAVDGRGRIHVGLLDPENGLMRHVEAAPPTGGEQIEPSDLAWVDGRLAVLWEDRRAADDWRLMLGFVRLGCGRAQCINGPRRVADASCDGIDDDCDGISDEDYAPVDDCGPPRCPDASVASSCVGGAEIRCAPAPLDELCGNAVDDDCNGVVDDRCNGCPDGTRVPAGWVCAPAGEFTMGSPGEVERFAPFEVQRRVVLTRPFLVATTETTQRDWQDLMGNNPSAQLGGDDHPVDNITWWDAAAYANALSTRDGFETCYDLDTCVGTAGEGEGLVCPPAPPVTSDCRGYRLPSEAEWEYATRASTDTAFWWGDDPVTDTCTPRADLDGLLWFCGNSDLDVPYPNARDCSQWDGRDRDIPARCGPHAVGERIGMQANPWGLYDTHGNVLEWVEDWWASDWVEPDDRDPVGPPVPELVENSCPLSGTLDPGSPCKAYRGGAYSNSTSLARSAMRRWRPPSVRGFTRGFRLVRTLPQP